MHFHNTPTKHIGNLIENKDSYLRQKVDFSTFSFKNLNGFRFFSKTEIDF